VESAIGPSRLAKFAPRVGFAWDPEGKGRSSMRGGYGIFFGIPRSETTMAGTRNQPFTVSVTNNNPLGGMADPYSTLPGGNPFPYTPPSTPDEFQKAKFTLPMTVAQWNPDFTTATIQQWNFNLQREFFGAYVVTAAYVGSKGNHLHMVVDANPAVYMAGASTTANQDARRPLAPYYTNIRDSVSAGNSTYHSLQLSLNKRFSRSFTVLAAYTWSKTIDDSSATPTGEGSTRNPRDFAMNRGRSNFDLTHRLVASYVWDLPRLEHQPALLRHVAGGWQTNGIVSLQDGLPLSITAGQDRSLVGANADYADLAGDPYLSLDRPRGEQIQQYFNKAAFAMPALGTFGTMGRNRLTGPGQATVNFGVFKSFQLAERHQLQFRSEFFNLFNRVNLGNPNTVFSNATFGRITSAGDPRVIQLALRYRF
jgi:hypothetical protein